MSSDYEFALPQQIRRGPQPTVKFETQPVLMEGKSKEAGRPIYEEQEFVRITNPGSKDVWFGKVTDKHKKDYPDHYRLWKETLKNPLVGTPIEQLPFLTKSRAMEYKTMNVHTAEDLAEISDGNLSACGMGTRDERAKAKAYLASAKDTALVTKQATELEAQNARIADLERQIVELQARFGPAEKAKGK